MNENQEALTEVQVLEVEAVSDLTERVDSLVQVLEEQATEPTPEELQEEQRLIEEQQVLSEQQAQEEIQFRTDLLLALSEVKTSLIDLNDNTLSLIEKTESNNSIVSEVAPYAKQASEWLLIAIVVMFLLWIVKQFEDMFNAAFR